MRIDERKAQDYAGETDLYEPRSLPEAVETELVGDLSGVHGVGKILLVGEDKQESITELILVEHALELLTRLRDTFPIVGVDDEDDTLGVLEVMSPQRTNLVLSTNIPHGELDVLVLDRLNVESCGARRVSVFKTED